MKTVKTTMIGEFIRQVAQKFAKICFGKTVVRLTSEFLFLKNFAMTEITISKNIQPEKPEINRLLRLKRFVSEFVYFFDAGAAKNVERAIFPVAWRLSRLTTT